MLAGRPWVDSMPDRSGSSSASPFAEFASTKNLESHIGRLLGSRKDHTAHALGLLQLQLDLHREILSGSYEGNQVISQALKSSLEARVMHSESQVMGFFDAFEAEHPDNADMIRTTNQKVAKIMASLASRLDQDFTQIANAQSKSWEELSKVYDQTLLRVNTALLAKIEAIDKGESTTAPKCSRRSKLALPSSLDSKLQTRRALTEARRRLCMTSG